MTNIIDKLINSISAVVIDGPATLPQERVNQYEELGSSYSKFVNDYKNADQKELWKNVFRSYTDEIKESNPNINDILKKIEITAINSIKENTVVFKIQNKSYVLFDSFTMKFLWMMNKAFYYGYYMDHSDTTYLFAEIFLHFASVINIKENKFIYPQPKTPPHREEISFLHLGFVTRIQEQFLIAHELGHIIIGEKTNDNKHAKFSSSYDLKYSNFHKKEASIDEELEADNLAFKMVINMYKKHGKEAIEIVCVNIFILIRYFVWLRISHIAEENDLEFKTWFARNNAMRHFINEAYKEYGSASFIVELFDYLESTMEPAALIAKEHYEKLKKTTHNSRS